MGRHSAPDDDTAADTAVVDGVPAAPAPVPAVPPGPASRPRPGRHDRDAPAPAETTDPHGLDVIETVMSGGPEPEPEREADPAPPSERGPAADERTGKIEPIVDPVLDEPLPVAVTTVFPPLVEDDRPTTDVPPVPAVPSPRPFPPEQDPASTDAEAAAEPEATTAAKSEAKVAQAAAKSEAKVAQAAAKSEAKAAQAAAKAETKAAKGSAQAEAKAAKAEAKAAKAVSTADAPVATGTRMSDLALLRADSAARARVIAAVVVPFLIYVGVLLALDTFDLRTVLVWIWLPLVTAGVVAGLLLDLAHRGAAARAITAGERAGADDRSADRS